MESDLPETDVGWTRVDKGKCYSYLAPPNSKGKRSTVSRTDHVTRLIAQGYSEDIKKFLIFSKRKLNSRETTITETRLDQSADEDFYASSPSFSGAICERREKTVYFGGVPDSPATGNPAQMEDTILVIVRDCLLLIMSSGDSGLNKLKALVVPLPKVKLKT